MKPERTTTRGQSGGFERYVLALALLVPVGAMLWVIGQVPGVTIASASDTLRADAGQTITLNRPQPSNAPPPPTLAPPPPTPKPTATLEPTPNPTATPQRGRTYVVKPGDELKHIAATYNVNIWKIVQTNDIPNPDSLRVGQELHIPDN